MNSRSSTRKNNLWSKRIKRYVLKPTTALLVAVLFWQVSYEVLGPNILSPFISTAEAAYNQIQPNGDGTIAGTRTTCATTNASCLDDGTATSSTPSTGGDYVTFNDGQADYYAMGTLSGVSAVSRIDVPVYHIEGNGNMAMYVSLWDTAEVVQYGTEVQFANRTGSQWDTASFTGLSLSQAQLDGLKVRIRCQRPGGGPKSTCRAFSAFAAVTYTQAINVTVSSLGNQQNLEVGTTSAFVGGAFAIVENTSSRNITSITISEQGTVDAQNELDNIKLYYEFDTTLPYNCSGLTYNGTETQFGSTDTDGFSGANGTSVFTGSVGITTTQAMCVYVVLDVTSSANFGDDLEIQITNPSTQVVGSGSPIVSPATAVLLPNTTTITSPYLTQENYHWRLDNGDQGDTGSGADSATGGSENTSFDAMSKGPTYRVRFAVSNEGNVTSAATQFRLEYATNTAGCSLASPWVNVGDSGGAFDMSNTGNLTDGNDTTNITVASKGAVSNPNTTFLSPNGGVRDVNSQTGSLTLTSTEYVELEYAVVANSWISDGTSYCFRVSGAGTPLSAYTNYAETTIAADVLVDTIGSEATSLSIPSTGQNAGGAFRVTDSTAGAGTITSVTITASGTVDYENDISNIRLLYDLDTSNPYTCDDVSYATTDSQFGSTDTDGFSAAGISTFTGSVSNSPTQTVCFYVEYDVGSGATNGELLDIRIADPSSDVVIGASTVSPAAPVDIDGVTTFSAPFVEQGNYHWRNNDGGETDAGATSATGGTQNTVFTDFAKNTTERLRIAVENTGLATASGYQLRLEWAQKVTTCSAATGWTRIDTASDEFQISPTGNLTDGANTTDILQVNGGVTNIATTFISSNGGVKDANDTTASVNLPDDDYLELEYSIAATDAAVQGATYCFRVTNAGTPLDNYITYPEATIKLDTDFKIQRGVTTTAATTLTLTAGVDYEAPASAANAFIRITNTQLTGAGPNTGNSNNNASDVTVYISNPNNLLTSVNFVRAGGTGNSRISWEIVEYIGSPGGENEIIVRRAESVAYGGANATVSGTVTNTIADDNDVVVFITAQNNADGGRNNYDYGLSTAAWNGGTNQADFTRGGTGAVSNVSYALVEFTGTNWIIQRDEHTYSSAGTVETSAITAVNSLSRTFLHVQKRTSQNNHADFGHNVWLSGIGQISYQLDGAASTPGNHTSVSWVIENTQTAGARMDVTRSNGTFASGGTGPETNNLSIGKTLDDLSIASIFANNRSDETQRSWPEPILGARIISTTQYELWRSDTTANISYRTEIVEWPTAARKLEQNYYRIYEDNEALLPTTAWPQGGGGTLGENTPMTGDDFPMVNGSTTRIRMTLSVTAAAMPSTLDSFKLQFGIKPGTCGGVAKWFDVGSPSSTTAPWRGVDNTPADGAVLSGDPPTGGDLLISIATVAGTYEESNNSALNPYTALPGDEVEYDWVVQHNGAQDKSSYCFRMVEADGTLLSAYNEYPELRTVGYDPRISNWRWYGDETNTTPSAPLAAENVAPIDIVNQDAIKLRIVLRESSGAAGVDLKFALQFSEYSDFSQSVATVTATSTCLEDSLWCFYDGAGVDNDAVSGTVISNANANGSHNEGTSTADATIDQAAYARSEYEFTIQHAGARANAVYYFRLYDMVNEEFVPLDTAASYPSLVTQGAQIVFSITGVTSGTTIGDVTTDAASTPTSVDFGSLAIGNDTVIAQDVGVDSNSTEGYKVYLYADQQLTNTYGNTILPVTGTNAVPLGWNTACAGAAVSCFGYHSTDGSLDGGSARFAPHDSYAAVTTGMEEILFSSVPAVDTNTIVYRIKVSELQPAGDYTTSLTYIIVPVF